MSRWWGPFRRTFHGEAALFRYQSLAALPSPAAVPSTVESVARGSSERPTGDHQLPIHPSATLASPIAEEQRAPRPLAGLPGDPPQALGEADGVVPDGVTVFDDEYPAVARLDPALLAALRRAATAAAGDGIELSVNSGRRSARYQEQLLPEAIAQYGSEEEAARWVASPDRSAHVTGNAVDIGPSGAAAWLPEHGARYGLRQIYGNEPWHDELRPEAVDHGCPAMYADPTHDPRLGQ